MRVNRKIPYFALAAGSALICFSAGVASQKELERRRNLHTVFTAKEYALTPGYDVVASLCHSNKSMIGNHLLIGKINRPENDRLVSKFDIDKGLITATDNNHDGDFSDPQDKIYQWLVEENSEMRKYAEPERLAQLFKEITKKNKE